MDCKEDYITQIIISSHYLEEEFVVWPVEDIFKIGKSDSVRTNGEFDKVGCVLVVDVIDHFRLLRRHTNSGATSHGNNLEVRRWEGEEGVGGR